MFSRVQFHKASAQPVQRDRGMTLVELLMTVTILGIIMTSLSAAMIVILRTERPIKDHLSESKDITFLQAWIPNDLASATSRNIEPLFQPSAIRLLVPTLSHPRPLPRAKLLIPARVRLAAAVSLAAVTPVAVPAEGAIQKLDNPSRRPSYG